MGRGEILTIALRTEADYAVLTFADGLKEIRKCTSWDASEWAGAAGLTFVLAEGDYFGWQQSSKPVTDSLD
jgi:hypothetical protein